jgi:N-acetylmuramic acid 6-phosphate etherase
MSEKSRKDALDFIANETQFHLGFLPTEQSNPDTVTLEADFRRSRLDGIATLQRPDRRIVPVARRVFASAEYTAMADAIADALASPSARIFFSGCGATGRLSILIESMWRDFFARRAGELSQEELALADRVESIMTGGDFALIRSVESFEDFASGGARQARERHIAEGDVFVAITEGGETSSVLGSLAAAADAGARCFLLFNNPAPLLREHLERCRHAIDDPRVTVLDLYCCPMALAGSTRMQATTSEQLVASSALEAALARRIPHLAPELPASPADAFEALLGSLESPAVRDGLAAFIAEEEGVYSRGGKITYLADDCMLDLFTDTTERSPTFMLPPFRSVRDRGLAPSWAFVKNPLAPTPECWRRLMRRDPRCLEWGAGDYAALGMDAPAANPPAIRLADLLTSQIGSEPCPERADDLAAESLALRFTVGAPAPADAFLAAADAFPGRFSARSSVHIGPGAPAGTAVAIPVSWTASPLEVFRHLSVKRCLNTVSTGTMVRLGRVAGNWMSWVSVSNKKLIDRGVRLLADLGGISYEDACVRIFRAIEEVAARDWGAFDTPSPVQYALAALRAEKGAR